MLKKLRSFHSPVGLRTLKTALAVSLALLVIDHLGASAAKIIFAVIGAIAAMEPTIKGAVRACVSQIGGVMIGTILALLMRQLPIHPEVAVGIGIVVTMALFQLLRWHHSPVLACLILVTICTDSTVVAHTYGLARIWDTAIGLAIGMAINMLIFPYDNSKKIRRAMLGLDKDLIDFLQDMFDGDEHLPETEEMSRTIDDLEAQLLLFADQRLIRRRRQKVLLKRLRRCEETAQELLVELRCLRNMNRAGRLDPENRKKLLALGAKISEQGPERSLSTEEIVINYHVAKILQLREQLKKELARSRWKSRREMERERADAAGEV